MKFMKIIFLSLLAIIAAGCQKRSGNIWEDNQTGAKYKYSDQNSSALWEKSSHHGAGLAGPVDEAFIPLSDDDLKNQFAEVSRELGEKGLPSADHFSDPKGKLATIFTPVFFNTNEHFFNKKEYLETIQRIGAFLKSSPKTYVIIEGYCDERGPEAFNMALGTRRANYVRILLLKQGVKPEQLHTISYGKERPFVVGHDPASWAQNRRAHFRVFSSQ
jgi:peptidoglycan-associated lipoprotein